MISEVPIGVALSGTVALRLTCVGLASWSVPPAGVAQERCALAQVGLPSLPNKLKSSALIEAPQGSGLVTTVFPADQTLGRRILGLLACGVLAVRGFTVLPAAVVIGLCNDC
jgi:hypothetical protein